MHGGDGASGGDPSIGRRRHVLREVKNKPIRTHTLRVWFFVRFSVSQRFWVRCITIRTNYEALGARQDNT